MGKFSFPKSERLSKRNSIQELFSGGSSFFINPFKILVQLNPDQSMPHQVLFSVSKRNFKRAVDRNLIKRRLREAFRLNKSLISECPKLQIVYIYTANELLPFEEIQSKLILTLKRLLNNYGQKN